ncbi:MAG: hypothetical protein Q8P67_04380 [archaeon]|nr:hypothetical protein [archaeon]
MGGAEIHLGGDDPEEAISPREYACLSVSDLASCGLLNLWKMQFLRMPFWKDLAVFDQDFCLDAMETGFSVVTSLTAP